MRLRALAFLLLAVPATAFAGAPPPSTSAAAPLQLRVELTDGTATVFDATLPLNAEHTCGSVTTTTAQGSIEARACRAAADVQGATIELQIDRTDAGKVALRQRLNATARVALGARAVVGKIASGGTATEVAITAR